MLKHATAALLILALAAAPAAAKEQATVRIAESATVRSPDFTLGQIGDVESGDAATDSELAAVRLGVSPMPGSWRELYRDTIATQLAAAGFDARRIKLVCPDIVRIFRASRTVTQDELEGRVRAFIEANSPWKPGEALISSVSRVGDVVVPAGALKINVSPRGAGDYIGPTPFAVELVVDGKVATSLTMQADISVYRDAVVATAPIPANSVVGPADVELRRIDISTARGRTFGSVDDVVGMATAAYLQPGSVVTAKVLRRPILVRRGDAVRLIASRPGFTIETSGIAQQDGRLGEVIRVLNPVSRKVVEAEVSGSQQARVLF